MPALFIHYKFGQDVLVNLNKSIQKSINSNIDYYNMFNQGFDNLYYYHFKWKYYKNFGVRIHKKNIDSFFRNLIKYIKDNNLENNSEFSNMLFGFINHYTLDTIIHPYINYQVSNLNISHTRIELMIDKKYHDFKSSSFKLLIPKLKFSKSLIYMLNDVFLNTYNVKNIGKIFNKSHNNGYYIFKYFVYDKFGIKTFIYKIVDYLLPFKDIVLHKNTLFIKEIDKRIFNYNKKYWNKPNNINDKYNYSLNDLYNIALKISIKLNNDAYKVLYNQKNVEELINKIKLIDLNNIDKLI